METLTLKCFRCDESISLEGSRQENNCAAYIIGWRMWSPRNKPGVTRYLCPEHAQEHVDNFVRARQRLRDMSPPVPSPVLSDQLDSTPLTVEEK